MNKHNALSQSELILMYTKNVYFIIDKKGIISYVSPSSSHIYKSKKNLLNTSFYDLVTEIDQDNIRKSILSIVTNPSLTTSFIFTQKTTKEKRIFQANAKNLLNNEKIKGILISVHEITENKHIQSFIKKHQDHLEHINFLNEQKKRDKTKKLQDQNKKLQEELLKQKQKESKFQEQSQQYKLLFTHANEAICVAQDGLLKLVNPKLCEMIQLHEEEIVNKPFINFIHPDDQELIFQRYSDRIKGKKVPDEYTFRTIDNSGKVHWVQIHAARFIWQGKPATVNFLTDITKKMYVQHKFETLFNNIPFLICELDVKNHTIVSVNPAFEKSIGVKKENLVTMDPKDFSKTFLTDETHKERWKIAQTAIKENKIISFSDKRDGRYFYSIFVPMDMPDGKRHLFVIAQDITNITLKEKKYQSLIDSTPDAIAEVDGETEKILLVNQAMAKNFNMTKEEMIGKDWKSFLPDELYEKKYQRGLKAITERKIQSFEDKRKDKYYHNFYIPFKSTEGSINLQIISRDITQLKNTEKKLWESEKKYRLLVEKSADVIYSLNIEDEKYTFISPAVEKLLGYSVEEAYLLKPTDILTSESYAYQKNELTKVLNSGKTSSGSLELDLIHKNGSIVQVDIHSSLLFNELKQPVGILGIVRDITQRKQAEKKLVEYKKALDQSAEGIAMANMEGNIKFVNKAWAKMHGFSVDELINKHLSIFHTLEQMEKQVTPFNQRLITSGSNEGEIGHVRKDGTTFPTYMTTTLIIGEDGKPLGLLGIARDITKEYHQREKERFNLKFHNLVAKASARFLQIRDKKTFDKVIDQTLESFGNLFRVDRSYLFRVSKDLSTMDYTYEWCAPEITSQKHRIKQTSLEKFSWWKTQMVKLNPILIPDVAKLPDEASVEKKELHSQGIQSLISIPICDDRKQLIGFLGFDSVMEKKSWSEKQVNMLQVLAEIIGNAIIRIETTIALSESEERYHMLFDQSQDAIMTLEPPLWKFTSGNPATIKMFGAEKADDFITLNPWDLSPKYQPDGQLSKEKAKEMIETAMRTGSHYFDWTHMRLNGTTFHATVLLSKLQIKKETYLQAVVRDITEKKKAEDALIKSEEKFRQISENMGEVFWLRNADNTKVLYVNPAYEIVWGRSCESLYETPQSFIDSIFDDDKPAVIAKFKQYMHSGEFNIEYRIVRADGDIRWIHARSFPVIDKKGIIIRHTGLAVDVTEQKQLEHELRLSKQHLEKRVKERTRNLEDTLNQLKQTEQNLREVHTYLKNVIDSASEFIFTLDNEYRITMWNKTAENITGKTSSQLIGKKINNVSNILNMQLLIDTLKNTCLGYGICETNLILKSKNNKMFTFDISCSLIDDESSKNKGYIIFGKNVIQARGIDEKIVLGSSYIQYKNTISNEETFLVDLQSQNKSILVITRESSQLTERINKLGIDILYLDDNTTDDTHIYTCEEVFSKISTYCNTHDYSVILINRLDYLIMNNSFETVLKLIYRINSVVTRTNAVLIIQVNSEMFSKNQLKLLEEELQLFKGFKIEEFSLDEPLYNLLRFIYEQNQNNVSVSYGTVGKHFDISKVTTGKRILELEQKGLVSISIKGRMKTIHTTMKGKELLISNKKP